MIKLNITQAAKVCVKSALDYAYWEDEVDSNFSQITTKQKEEILSEIKGIIMQSIGIYLNISGQSLYYEVKGE
jgi:hypothetical protein